MIPLLLPTTWFGWTLLVGVVAVLVLVAAIVLCMPAAARADRDAARHAARLDEHPLPVLPRAWLIPDARVRHDVLGLGTVVDTEHSPYPGQVLVRFDALSDVRWTRTRECDPVQPDDEERLRELDERRARLQSVDGAQTGVWPRECGPSGHPMARCYWHGPSCGSEAPFGDYGPQYCCSSCPARGGAA